MLFLFELGADEDVVVGFEHLRDGGDGGVVGVGGDGFHQLDETRCVEGEGEFAGGAFGGSGGE